MFVVHPLRRAQRGPRQAAFEIRRQIERELRLRAIAIEDLLDRLNVAERRVDDLLPDPARERFGPQLREPGIEWRGSNGRKGLGGSCAAADPATASAIVASTRTVKTAR